MRVRVQEWRPDFADIGVDLDETLRLRVDHEELTHGINERFCDVVRLAKKEDEDDEQIPETNSPENAAIEHYLAEIWNDLSEKLELRKRLLDQAIIFYQLINEVCLLSIFDYFLEI